MAWREASLHRDRDGAAEPRVELIAAATGSVVSGIVLLVKHRFPKQIAPLTVGAFAAIEIIAMPIIRNDLPVFIAAVVMVVAVLVLTGLTLLRER
ncbi:hypothetical protein AB4Y72_14920 [Arthrobacter sp. YAF34]|uniref:hypothetical protein n=1 Tax=Arthrobacter sp. YAF34 TaxID=3233083 RepID=UPI003F93EC14